MSPDKPTNRLIGESSLYLQQHAHNPIDWYPWGEEAFAKAEAEDKPILVSIGYSSCHWCHVMERESFEDPEVAAYQNKHFVSIKVDREERPDVDRIYMAACQILTHSGGWPLNAFLLPDGRPFFAGTYFPPRRRYNRPSWLELLQRLYEAFLLKREQVEEDAAELTQMIELGEKRGKGEATPTSQELQEAAVKLSRSMDPVHGGFGRAPKFPSVMALEVLFYHVARHPQPALRELLVLTLDAMADGGIYDHLGGGFHRYSTDAQWAVPHFEKMLYDNGLLLRLYAEGYRQTQDPRYAEVLREVAAYLKREMTAPEGAFYASQDADSEGEEGLFFIWTPEQIQAVVGEEDAALVCQWFGVTEAGNFEDSSSTVLARKLELEALAAQSGLSEADAKARLDAARQKLWEAREQRSKPARDEKRITAWSALAIQGLSRGGLLLGDPQLLQQAQDAAQFYLDSLDHNEGRLYRIYARHPEADEARWSVPGFLDDYSFLALAFFDLFQATGEMRFFEGAQRLLEGIFARFYADDHFRFAPDDGEALIVETRSTVDEATPSATAAAFLATQRLALATAQDHRLDDLRPLLAAFAPEMLRFPQGFSSFLHGLDAHHYSPKAVVCLLPEALDPQESLALRARIAQMLMPCDQLYLFVEGQQTPDALAHFTEGRQTLDGAITYYVCDDKSCQLPTPNLDAIPQLLRGFEAPAST